MTMITHVEQGRDGSWCVYGKYQGRPYCAHGRTKAGALREAESLKVDVMARAKVVQFPRPNPALVPTGPSAA